MIERATLIDALRHVGGINDPARRIDALATCARHALAIDGEALEAVRLVAVRLLGAVDGAALIERVRREQAARTERAAAVEVVAEPPGAPESTLELDPELGRIAYGLGYGLSLLAWAAGRAADTAGRGIVSIGQIVEALRQRGGKANVKTVRRWIAAGEGVFFTTSRIGIHLTGYAKLGERLARLAVERRKPDLVSTNPPGAQFVRVPVATSKRAWAANLYAAWHNSRADHTRQISRFALSALWQTTRAQLIKWERLAGIGVTAVYALHTVDGSDIPEYAEPILTRRERQEQYRARYSNVYNAPSMRIKHHRKIVSAARRRARLAIETIQTDGKSTPVSNCGLTAATAGGATDGQLVTTGRLVFFDGRGAAAAAKRLQRHYRHTSERARRHYIELGRDRFGNIVIEQSQDGLLRCSVNDIAARAAADVYFQQRGGRAARRAWLRGAL